MRHVQLDQDEAFHAGMAGYMRAFRHYIEQTRDYNGTLSIDTWRANIEGAIAEALVAKTFKRYWPSVVKNFKQLRGDVGELQVRHTRLHNGCLLLHEKDADDAKFVLVTGGIQDMKIRGWLVGKDGKQAKFWRNVDRPCFFVPQACLKKETF